MLKAGIDIGTNTILLLIAEVEANRIVRVLEDHVTVVRLGQGVDKNRAFHPEALDRAHACFAAYAEILKKYPGIPVKAVATSGSRDARNSGEFFADVKAKYGIPVEVISGEDEAMYSFRGSLPEGADPTTVAVLDIGGGSTEIVGMENGELFRVSFNVGCVRLSERFLQHDPPTEHELLDAEDLVNGMFIKYGKLFDKVKSRRLIGVAGTATYLSSAALGLTKFDPEKIHGSVLTSAALDQLIVSLSQLTNAERLGIGGMDKGRADVIIGGAIVLEKYWKHTKLESLEISVRGLRYGLVL